VKSSQKQPSCEKVGEKSWEIKGIVAKNGCNDVNNNGIAAKNGCNDVNVNKF